MGCVGTSILAQKFEPTKKGNSLHPMGEQTALESILVGAASMLRSNLLDVLG